eukprot:m.284847 g.284847  ORF g.284847 m.284847 type:complete len:113 (+) comp19914_c0_seq5:1703-2041(+)
MCVPGRRSEWEGVYMCCVDMVATSLKWAVVARYVPVVLPAVEVHEEPMPTDTVDYLVLLSKLHDGGDIRETKEHDLGAYDTMKSYQLKDNPGYVQHSARKARGKNKPSADEL